MMREPADDGKKLMAIAAQAAHRMGHSAVDSEHILVAAVEMARSVFPESISDETRERLREAFETVAPRGDHQGLGRLPITTCVQSTLELAAFLAHERGSENVDTPDLFAAVLLLPENSGARRMLDLAGLNESDVRSWSSSVDAPESKICASAERELGHAAKVVAEHAHAVAREYQFERAQPWHLLVALAENPDVITKDVLDRLGITAAIIRSEISSIIDEISRGGG
jgi:ATP-dependent Clp protease ATP-binding subunit ClpA